MKEKISQLIHGSKEEEAARDKQPEQEAPPPPYQEYEQGKGDSQAPPQAIPSYGEKDQEKGYQQGYGGQPPQAGYDNAPQGYPQEYTQGYGNPPQGYQGEQYDPMKDPNVIKVKPQMVNISQANPEHLNPSYQQYLQRDAQRIQQGDFPKPHDYYKHGAPLSQGKVNPKLKTGGGAFPGRGGATYDSAANR